MMSPPLEPMESPHFEGFHSQKLEDHPNQELLQSRGGSDSTNGSMGYNEPYRLSDERRPYDLEEGMLIDTTSNHRLEN
jgi:hypothetical protein